jgi:hypothetical protein
MPTRSEIDFLRQDFAIELEHGEESVTIGRGPQIFWRWPTAVDAMNAHSQADEPPGPLK